MLSRQPVHSCSCSQTTFGRLALPSFAAISLASPLELPVVTAAAPMTRAILPQNVKKSRLLTPRRARNAAKVSPLSHGSSREGFISMLQSGCLPVYFLREDAH